MLRFRELGVTVSGAKASASKPLTIPKGPCTQIVYSLGPMYLHKEYFKAKVYTIWIHGPLGNVIWAKLWSIQAGMSFQGGLQARLLLGLRLRAYAFCYGSP